MIVYLINMSACALLLLALYTLLFEREKMHHFKRIYLLFSLIFSMTIPLLHLTVDLTDTSAAVGFLISRADNLIHSADNRRVIIEKASPDKTAENRIEKVNRMEKAPIGLSINFVPVILSAYILVTLLFLFRLLKNYKRILAYGRKNACIKYKGASMVLIDEKTVPYSFGRYIFVSRADYCNGLVAEEILIHEWAHVSQRHTWDIVLSN